VLALQLFLKRLKTPLDIFSSKFVPISEDFVFKFWIFVLRKSFFGGSSRGFVGKFIIKYK